jgi:adenosyl cobinamide kinase/adenosyl cobinamide phosphate guanylyltransferase
MTNTRPLRETFGAYWDVVTLLAYGEERNNVLLVSDRTLYILNNLSLVDIHQLGRYYTEKYSNGYASFLDDLDSEAADVMDVANNVGLELFPVTDIRPIYGFTAAALGANQSIPNNTDEPVAWTTVDSLDPEFVTRSGEVFTIKREGRIHITANAWWAASTAGNRRILIYRNGSPVLHHRTPPVLNTSFHQSCSFSFSCFQDETLQMFVYQNSGAALDLATNGAPNFNTSFSVVGF